MMESLLIIWEGKEDNYIQEKSSFSVLISEQDTLEDVYSSMIDNSPELCDILFTFVHNDIPISPELWSIVKAFNLAPNVYIREGVFDIIRRVQTDIVVVVVDDYLHIQQRDKNILTAKVNEMITVQVYEYGAEWWFGSIDKRSGWFPAKYTRLIQEENEEDKEYNENTI